jgi:UDP-GlcNAc3NAcA epimerase
MIRVLTVVGARPQFVKAAVISRLIRSETYRNRISETLIHTGQHYDENMSEVFFREMEIPDPDVNLNIGSGGHGHMTGAMLAKIEDLLLEQRFE